MAPQKEQSPDAKKRKVDVETTYEVFYYQIGGRAGPIRYLLEAAGEKYTNRYPKEWPAEKGETTFGQMPMLTETTGDKKFILCQSHAIIRYLAKKFGLWPEDEKDAAIVDSYYESINDLYSHLIEMWMAKDDEAKGKTEEKLKTTIVPAFLKVQEKRLGATKGLYSSTDKISYMDYVSTANYELLFKFFPTVANKTTAPLGQKLVDRINAQPRIAEYKKSDRFL